MQTFYRYLADQKSLNGEYINFTENLVLQISSNFFLCQHKCTNHLFREVLVNAQTKKYIICDSNKRCSNCERIKSMIMMSKVPAITDDLMKSSNLKRFYLKWVSIFDNFLKRLTEGSVFESELERVDCYKNTGDRRMMMQPRKKTNFCGFSESVHSASTMKREIHLFITKYRIDRSMQVFSKALEPQNLEFFINYDHLKIKRTIDYKTGAYVKKVDIVSPFVCDIEVIDLKRNQEMHEKKRGTLLQLIFVEIFKTLVLGETGCCSKEIANIMSCLVATFSDVGPWITCMSSLTDSGEYVLKDGLFKLPQSSFRKKMVVELGQELGFGGVQ